MIGNMGRLVLLLLIIVTVVLLWKAFGPATWKRSGQGLGMGRIGRREQQAEPQLKGPDDDPDFLWNIEKERFKKRREQERAAEKAAEQERQRQRREELRKQREERGDEEER